MLRAGHGLILAVLTLLVIGIVMVNSAGLVVAPDPSLLQSGQVTAEQFERMVANYRPISFEQIFFGRTTILAFISLAALAAAAFVPVDRLLTLRGARSPIPWILGGIILTLVLVHVPGIGREVNGSSRWIGPAWLGFQPSEFAKWAMLFVAAWFCVHHADRVRSFKRGFLPAFAVLAVIVALIGKEDLGTAALVFCTCTMLWHVALLLPFGALAAVGAIVTSPYRVNRLVAYSNPWQDAEGIGYHIIQSMSAIAGGGLSGHGLGNGLQKFGYLPEDTTDFIYAIICEELGIVGAIAVVALFATVLLCGLSIVTRGAKRPEADAIVPPFSRLFGLGVLLTIGIQALINLCVVTGLAPTKGIALPFLSSGGSGWVATGFSIGLLLSIERNAIRRERELGIDSSDDAHDSTLASPSVATT